MPSVRFSQGQAQETSTPSAAEASRAGGILRNSTEPNQPKKTSIFGNFFASQKQEYHGEQTSSKQATNQQQNNQQSSQGSGQGGAQGSNNQGGNQQRRFNTQGSVPSSSGGNEEEEQVGFVTRCCGSVSGWFRPSRAALDRMTSIISSRFWNMVLVFFTILLLFGEQFQELFIPKEGDIVFDVLFTIALAVFFIDIILRCYVEPQFFGYCGKDSNENSTWGSFQLGSFMFWCDLISSATLLYDISYINRSLFQINTIDIVLNSLGLPVSSITVFSIMSTILPPF